MTNVNHEYISGLNIQAPWSRLIVEGKKTIETRSYPLPEKHIGQPLAIIETPGPQRLVKKAQIVGIVWFSGCIKYSSKHEWAEDFQRHLVPTSDPNFGYSPKKPKFGWVVERVQSFSIPLVAPQRRGIIFATNCCVIID